MKTGFCCQATSSRFCWGWKLENNKFIWRLGRQASTAVSRFSSKRGAKECADTVWRPRRCTTDHTKYRHCSLLRLLTRTNRALCAESTVRVPCRCTGSRGGKGEVVFSCRQVEVRVFCNHILKGQRQIKRLKKKINPQLLLSALKEAFFSFLCWLYHRGINLCDNLH